jgi:hypothetical protein
MGVLSDALMSTRGLASVPEGSPWEVIAMSVPGVENRDPERGGHSAPEQLLDATPVTERQLMLAGISTTVLIGGDGPPIVLLHGPGEFALTWLRVVPELVKTHRVIVPDLPGHGGSLLGDAPLDADRVLSWLGELIERTDLPVACLPGWSPARRRHRAEIRHRSQRETPWACPGGHLRSVPSPTIAAVHSHFDQLPREANGRQP